MATAHLTEIRHQASWAKSRETTMVGVCVYSWRAARLGSAIETENFASTRILYVDWLFYPTTAMLMTSSAPSRQSLRSIYTHCLDARIHNAQPPVARTADSDRSRLASMARHRAVLESR